MEFPILVHCGYATPYNIERRRNRNVIFLQALLSHMISCNGIARTWGCHHPRAHSATAGTVPAPLHMLGSGGIQPVTYHRRAVCGRGVIIKYVEFR